MIRVLIVDDEDVTISHVRKLEEVIIANFEGEKPDVRFVHVTSDDSAILRAQLAEMAKEHWDVLLIDVNLYPEKEGMPPILVPCQLVEEFRKSNQAASVFIYSGLIEQHLEKIFSLRDEGEKSRLIETHIRQIFSLGIAAFSANNKVVDDAMNRLHNPPPLLRIERELLVHGKRKFRGDSPLKGKTLEELATEVRSGTSIGRGIVDLVAREGVSSVVDLNT